MYYLRTRPAVQAIQFTVSAATLKAAKDANQQAADTKAATVTVSPTPAAILPSPPAAAPSPLKAMAMANGNGAAGTPPALKKTRDVLGEIRNMPNQARAVDSKIHTPVDSPQSENDTAGMTYEDALRRKAEKGSRAGKATVLFDEQRGLRDVLGECLYFC